jgi:hemerythrin-like domain-containing protein
MRDVLTGPLREEHRVLLPHVEQLRQAADLVGSESLADIRLEVRESLRFLNGHLLPHAHAEEAALYPVVGQVMGSPDATATMSRDHIEIARLIEELEHLERRMAPDETDEPLERELRRILYGLYALVSVHFRKEEEVYLPLLVARLSAHEAEIMFHNMETAAHEAMRHVH